MYKRTLSLAILFAAFAVAVPAEAIVPPPVTTPPATVPTSSSSSSSVSGSDSSSAAVSTSASESSAASNSVSNSSSTSAGGNAAQKQGQQQQQGQAATLNNSDNSRSGYYVLPGPVWTPPMAKVDCPTPKIENRSLAVGWGLFSIARGDTITDDCMGYLLHNTLIDQCQYASAKQVRDEMIKKLYPGFNPTKPNERLIDYTPDECASAKRLQAFGPPPPAPVTNNYITNTTTPPPACPPAPVKRRVVGGAKPKNTCGK